MNCSPRRQNFLFIITDQHRADHLGCYGHPVLRTPNIDSLAHRGVTMDRAYVASPICMPNRSTLMTGRMPSVHGVRHNGIDLSLESVTFVDLLAASGYGTALVGKSHLQNFSGVPAQRRGEPIRPGDHAPPPQLREAVRRQQGDYMQEDVARWRSDNLFDLTLPFYGFQKVDLTVGHGDEVDGHYGRWLRERAPELDIERIGEPRRRGPDMELQQSWVTRLPEELYPTNWVADRTIARLERFAREPGVPFFLYCSFPDPHHPFTPPGRYRNLFDPATMTLPASWYQPDGQAPPHVRWLRNERDAGRAVRHGPAAYACSEREMREAMALSFGMITMIDDAIGRILAALQRLGLTEETVVIFTTDHGEFLGDHQLMLKAPIHYQSLIRTPLIWSDPRYQERHGSRSSALCGTVDLARTVLDAARVAPCNGMQGRSLMPVLTGDDDVLHDSVLVEEEGQRISYGFDAPVRMRSLVTDRYRLSVYDGVRWGELYDLIADPHELENLWDVPRQRGTRNDLMAQMMREMLTATDCSPLPAFMA